MKALKIEPNKAGRRYALVPKADGTFMVFAECHNYAAHVRGGIATSWRVHAQGLPRDAADALFARRVAGKARA